MTPKPTTRRRYLGAFATALTGGLAGCSGVLGGQDSNTTDGSPTTATNTSAQSNATNGTRTGNTSPYTQVYRETIQSVVLVSVTTARGSGQGSGFVYRDNYVVTNAHVVANARSVRVRFARGQWRSATVVGTDASSDLAVLQVQNAPGYARPLPLVENQPAVGTKVAAIGNPYGLRGTLTTGVVSGVNRSIPAPNGRTIPDAIQTDAPANPGNSGGPLVNLDGEVVGVISSGGGDNLAFAVSAALMKRVLPALIEDGDYDYAYLGIIPETVTPSAAERLGLDRPRGVVVRRVRSGTPAAGTLRQGDVILAINGNRIDTVQQLSSYLALQVSPGETVEITVLRNGERRTVSLTLGTRPEQPGTRGRATTPR